METISTIAHTDPALPAFGFVAHPGDFFSRALRAKQQAASVLAGAERHVALEFMAGNLDGPTDDFDHRYHRRDIRTATAGQAYATAVFEAAAGQVRAR